MTLSPSQRAEYLVPTPHIDCTNEAIIQYVARVTKGLETDKEKGIALFDAVRDDVIYDPYYYDLSPEGMRGSAILLKGRGYCVAKALVLTTTARAAGIPCRIGFADVRNHLSTQKLRDLMGTDLFVYHGYSELYIEGRWLKVTPTFNTSLCDKFGVHPLVFDGESDCLFHPFDAQGRKHMEYVRDRGYYEDLPVDELINACIEAYPKLFQTLESLAGEQQAGNFEAEAQQEATLI